MTTLPAPDSRAPRAVTDPLPVSPGQFCLRCGSLAPPASGPYLALLYPFERFCSPCGRRECFCTCRQKEAA